MLAQMVCPRPNGQYLVCKEGAPLTRARGGGGGVKSYLGNARFNGPLCQKGASLTLPSLT